MRTDDDMMTQFGVGEEAPEDAPITAAPPTDAPET